MKAGSQSLNDAMDCDKAGDAKGQTERTRNECRAKPAGRIEPPVAPKRYHNISAEVRKVPSGEPSADGDHHSQFEKATADRARKTARCQDLGEQSYRHSYLTAIRRLLQTFRFNGRGFFLLSYVPIILCTHSAHT